VTEPTRRGNYKGSKVENVNATIANEVLHRRVSAWSTLDVSADIELTGNDGQT